MTITTLKVKVVGVVNAYRQRERDRHKYVLAVAGNNAGTLDVVGRTGFIYMRLRGEQNQVIEVQADASVPLDAGNPYIVEEIHRSGGMRYRVKGIAAEIYADDPRTNLPGRHGVEHERDDCGDGGSDPTNVHTRAYVPVRAQPQAAPDWTLVVCAGWFRDVNGEAYHYAGGNSPVFTPPAAWGSVARRCDLLYFDAAHGLTILQGTDITIDGSEPDQPTLPDPCTPIAFVYLDSMMTALGVETKIRDPRLLVGSSASQITNVGAAIHAAAADTPLDADEFGFYDVIDAVLKKITWLNIKSTLKTYFDGLYAVLAHTHTGTTDSPKLAQANTHESADTDAATSSLHHTIGVGATQAAAGNHAHASSTAGWGRTFAMMGG